MKRRIPHLLISGLSVLVALLVSLVTVSAQEGQPVYPPGTGVTDDQVNAIAKGIYCPVCPNTPLDVCETQACKDWRAQIKDQLSQGWSEQQIVTYFVDQYGERVLGEPRQKGFTSLVWVLPLIFVLFGVVMVGIVLKNWRINQAIVSQASAMQNPSPAAPPISDELRALIENEVRRFD
jgi:cytochrome c-type biogenesis protein CcmH